MKRLEDLCHTREQRRLFRAFADSGNPGAWSIPWEAADVHAINGKRILCLKFQPAGSPEPLYSHFCPSGVTDEEARIITEAHGLDEFSFITREKKP
jgi:hypothetical protein